MDMLEMVATGLYEELTGSLDQGKWSCYVHRIRKDCWTVRACLAPPHDVPQIQILLTPDNIGWCGVYSERYSERDRLIRRVTTERVFDYNDPASLDRVLADAIEWLLAHEHPLETAGDGFIRGK